MPAVSIDIRSGGVANIAGVTAFDRRAPDIYDSP
jgi:hypothetical protein